MESADEKRYYLWIRIDVARIEYNKILKEQYYNNIAIIY